MKLMHIPGTLNEDTKVQRYLRTFYEGNIPSKVPKVLPSFGTKVPYVLSRYRNMYHVHFFSGEFRARRLAAGVVVACGAPYAVLG